MNSPPDDLPADNRHLYDGAEEEPCVGTEFLLPGPAGDLQVLTNYPDGCPRGAPVGIICHPHPLYGGSMANKVVHILAASLKDMGLPSVRFNFRGVGKSQGEFDDGRGESQDLLAVTNWLRQRHPDSPLWLAGFSFGAFVAWRAHRDAGAARLLLVAPPVRMFSFEGVGEVEVSWWVVQGGRDEITDPQAVSDWVQRQAHPPGFVSLPEADHFFHGQLNAIRAAVVHAWS
ncbi:MAG: alpha/beta hydrolase [Pseudomonadota bacterium]|nr:MAG: alpha/beta hydrolase [Pseudomonadota bacterium]